MRILLTNDDGIHAPGLSVLEDIARSLSDDIWIIAPETDQSGVSHSLTLSDPLRARQIDTRRFAVSGTPTDCVIMGVKSLLDRKPDLVLSGVNLGQNIADDTTYSGTIAGAMEGRALGVRSFALSQAYGWNTGSDVQWDCARHLAPEIIRTLLTDECPRDIIYNLNFPDCAPDDVCGVDVTRQGKRDQNLLRVDERQDGRGKPYYWFGFDRHLSSPSQGTDLYAIYNRRVAITPVKLDLTDHEHLQALKTLVSGKL